MFSVELIAVFFRYFPAHLTNGREQIGRDAGKLIRIGGVNENADRKIYGHLFEALLLPILNRTECFGCGVLITQLVNRTTLPDELDIACTGFVTLFRDHGSKQNLIHTGLQTDALSFLYICADFYDQLCVFS